MVTPTHSRGSKKATSGRSTRKVAMVQLTPKPAGDLPIFAILELQARLIKTLQVLKNDRAYTVLEYHNKWAAVHFEGDINPSSIYYD